MRLMPSDPDVETIVSRIEAKDLNLQPDFQRGEVWSRGKKQRLVDSILRDWHVPPIHVIENRETRRQEVLDGQQRLVAIRDFFRDEFPIDGSLEPKDPRIAAFDGKRYSELPSEVQRQINQFTIRVFRIVDYNSTEPAELFFRLNQPTNLTSAEQRNAYFGPVRKQIRTLAEELGQFGLDRDFLGFSNARMAYDDVLSRAAFCIERGTIAEKIASTDLVEIYRNDSPLAEATILSLRTALTKLGSARQFGKRHPRFNKATFFSWIVFLVRSHYGAFAEPVEAAEVADLLELFDRHGADAVPGFDDRNLFDNNANAITVTWLLDVYRDRATSRVSDVSSVLLRDLTSWILLRHLRSRYRQSAFFDLPPTLREINDTLVKQDPDRLAQHALETGWGRLR